ncbi:MAG: V-type ATP synthase subunit D [Methylomarinum sp.]|nr:V-type ATP synthase subunit D [Methylomarinum sp.]
MTRLSFSKASLHKEGAQLKRYQQYLPSLDLKRQQLIAERSKAITQLSVTEAQIKACYACVEEQLPMLFNELIKLDDLVWVEQVVINEENLVGIKLPVLQQIDIKKKEYSFLSKPHWVDLLVVKLTEMLELKVQLKVNQQRLAILQQAVKKISQRVNLFDKVLIPKAQQNIGKIKIFLSDAERAAVVRAKITKQKRLRDDVEQT